MNNMLSYKGYYGSVEYCDVDNILHGEIIGINDSISYHGDSVKSLREAFVESVDDYLEICKAKGKEPQKAYKGNFNVRIKPVLHRRLVMHSQAKRLSLNTCIEEAISSYLN